jgi:ABC-2 type transport system ATP-binding protein
MSADLAARVSGVSKFYGEFAAVSELSFEVEVGLIYGILGPNGAGKSTTLRMLNDIIAPDQGEIELLGKYRPGLEAARHIGYLPEERGLYPKMPVGETLEFFGQLRGLEPPEARKRSRAWLERLGLETWVSKKIQDLSKGMQQKVQFASALIHEPQLLILDEPWSGLDPLNAEVLRDIVLEHKAQGQTVLFSTHLMEQAEQICDRVCIIAGGKRVLEGELATIRRQAAPVGLVALGFADDGDAERAKAGVLADPAVVASYKERADHFEIQLCPEVEPDTLLRSVLDSGYQIQRFEKFEPTLHQIFVDRVGSAAAPRNAEGGDA